MIILFDEQEKDFASLGIGVLSDAITCTVTEELSGYFELEMEYPVTGTHYKDIKHKRIILAPANDVYENTQPFRIYKITKPINGIVTVYAEHISYDTSRIPIKKIWANNLTELKALLQNDQDTFITNCNFNFITDKTSDVAFETKKPMSYRSLLLGDDNSILSVYDGEYIFDRFDIKFVTSRGKDSGFTVRYSKNMTDFEQELTADVLYTGVMPYYSNEVTQNKTGLVQTYTTMYLSEEALTSNLEERLVPENYTDPDTGETYEIFPDKFFCYESEKAKGFILSLLNTPNIIAAGSDPQNPDATYTYPDGTKKSLLNHIFIGKKLRLDPDDPLSVKKCYVDVTGVMAYIRKSAVEFSEGWLTDSPENTTTPIRPEVGKIYRIFSEDKNYKYKAYTWDTTLSKYTEWLGEDGNGDPYKPKNNSVSTEQETNDVLVTLDENILFIDEVRCKIAIDPITINKASNEYRQYTLDVGVEKELITIDSSKTSELGYNVYSYYNSSVKTTYLFSLSNTYAPYSIMSYVDMINDKKASAWITQEVTDESDLLYINKRYNEDVNKFTSSWLKSQKWDSVRAEFIDDENPISNPKKDIPYTIFSTGMFYGKTYYWNGMQYVSSESLNKDQRILTVDLTDHFQQEPPTQVELYNETLRYIKDNEIGTLKDSIKVSFVKLSSTPEYSKWKDLEKVNLGDIVTVIYSAHDISVKKRVVKTVYNVLKNSYDEIELGKKSVAFTSNVIMSGDDVSNLSNDRNFAEYSKVTELVAESITAEKIKAYTAEITKAQIEQLEVAQINITGCIQATSLEIDELIAGLIVTDNAAIRNQLTVGEGVIVNGEINIKSGSISIVDDNTLDYVKVYIKENATEYSSSWLKENLDSELPIVPQENVIYKVYDNHNIWTQEYYTWSTNAQRYNIYDPNNITMFEVDKDGNLYANSVTITGGSITIQNSDNNTMFEVNNNGELFANSVELTGKITATSGDIGGCVINGAPSTYTEAFINPNASYEYSSDWLMDENDIVIAPQQNVYYKVIEDNLEYYYLWSGSQYEDQKVGILQVGEASIGSISADIIHGGTISASEIMLGYRVDDDSYNFSVNSEGKVIAKDIYIIGGDLHIESGDLGYFVEISEDGSLSANNVSLEGTITATLGIIGGCSIVQEEPSEGSTNTQIRNGQPKYSRTWLDYKPSRGGHHLNPSDGRYYNVEEDNILKYYQWDESLERYVLYDSPGVLQVAEANISGTLTANKIVGGSISASDISLGKIGEDDQGNKYYNLFIDGDSGEVDIRSGSIQLGQHVIEVQADGGEEPFTEDWLIYEGGITVVPEVGKYYKVTNGTYRNKIFTWNSSTSLYKEVPAYSSEIPYNFSVTDAGIATINKGEINLGLDDSTGEYNFSVDNNGNIQLRKGSISIKFNSEKAYINSSATVFSSTWLKDVEGHIYSPEEDTYYQVLTSGTYYEKYYIWNASGYKYDEVEAKDVPTGNIFQVTKNGNLLANNCSITGSIASANGGQLRIDDITTNGISVSGDLIVNAMKDNQGNVTNYVKIGCPIEFSDNISIYKLQENPRIQTRNDYVDAALQLKYNATSNETTIMYKFYLRNGSHSGDITKINFLIKNIWFTYLINGDQERKGYLVPYRPYENVTFDTSNSEFIFYAGVVQGQVIENSIVPKLGTSSSPFSIDYDCRNVQKTISEEIVSDEYLYLDAGTVLGTNLGIKITQSAYHNYNEKYWDTVYVKNIDTTDIHITAPYYDSSNEHGIFIDYSISNDTYSKVSITNSKIDAKWSNLYVMRNYVWNGVAYGDYEPYMVQVPRIFTIRKTLTQGEHEFTYYEGTVGGTTYTSDLVDDSGNTYSFDTILYVHATQVNYDSVGNAPFAIDEQHKQIKIKSPWRTEEYTIIIIGY